MDLDRVSPSLLVVLALLAGLTCQLLLGTSYVAASLDPLDRDGGVAVAVVDLDAGPHGGELLARLQSSSSPITWVALDARQAAMEGLAEKRYFGAIVIPANFSADLDSFASGAPRGAFVETFANPGASTSGSLIASRAIELALEATRARVREEALARSSVATTGLGGLTLEQGRYLAEPIRARHIDVNVVPDDGANGLAPTYLAMAAWIGGYLGAVALERFRPRTRVGPLVRTALVAAASLAQGLLAVLAIRAIGFTLRDPIELALLLAAGTWMAYTVVSLLMDTLGLAGVLPAFAILAIGLPASGALYPEGLLPDLYRAIHAVDPFTWLVEGLRTTLYAPAARDLAGHFWSLVALGVACALVSAALGAWRGRNLLPRRAH